jgi:hypothetical protein
MVVVPCLFGLLILGSVFAFSYMGADLKITFALSGTTIRELNTGADGAHSCFRPGHLREFSTLAHSALPGGL